jgi:hypothetical protein
MLYCDNTGTLFSLTDLRFRHPSTSWPADPSVAALASFGYFRVVEAPAPDFDPETEIAQQAATAVNVAGTWRRPWPKRSLTAPELQQRARARALQVLANSDGPMIRVVEEIYEVLMGRAADISQAAKDRIAARAAARQELGQ